MPVTSELSFPNGGAVSYFKGTQCNGGDPLSSGVVAGSAIYYSPATGTHEVQSCIFQHYAFLFGPSSSIPGYPTSDEHIIAGGYASDFQGTSCSGGSWGHIFYSAATGAREVHGCIDDAYIHPFGGPSGFLGFPTTDVQTTINSGWVSNFQGTSCSSGSYGRIYYSAATGTHEVNGCIDRRYRLDCYRGSGACINVPGLPVSDEIAYSVNGGGHVSYFAGQNSCGGYTLGTGAKAGSAIYSGPAGTYEVQGCIFATYTGIFGPASVLGWPTSDEHTNTNNQPESDFQHGKLVWNGSQVVVTLT